MSECGHPPKLLRYGRTQRVDTDRQCDWPWRGQLLDSALDGCSIDVWHLEVADDEIIGMLGELLERRLAAVYCLDRVAVTLKYRLGSARPARVGRPRRRCVPPGQRSARRRSPPSDPDFDRVGMCCPTCPPRRGRLYFRITPAEERQTGRPRKGSMRAGTGSDPPRMSGVTIAPLRARFPYLIIVAPDRVFFLRHGMACDYAPGTSLKVGYTENEDGVMDVVSIQPGS